MWQNEQEVQKLEYEIEGLQAKKTSLERMHKYLIKREALEADYITWAKQEADPDGVAEHQSSLQQSSAEAASVEEKLLQNARVEFALRKRITELQRIITKHQEQLAGYNDLHANYGYGNSAYSSVDVRSTQWVSVLLNYFVETLHFHNRHINSYSALKFYYF